MNEEGIAAVGPGVVMGVIGADVHAVGNRILEYALRQAGFRVTNLGIMVSQEEFVQAAVETDAAVILVSSLYGHGELDCRGLRAKCTEAGLDAILLYVGGNLVVGNRPWAEVERTFRDMGFDRVAAPGTRPEQVLAFLRADLGWPPPVPEGGALPGSAGPVDGNAGDIECHPRRTSKGDPANGVGAAM